MGCPQNGSDLQKGEISLYSGMGTDGNHSKPDLSKWHGRKGQGSVARFFQLYHGALRATNYARTGKRQVGTCALSTEHEKARKTILGNEYVTPRYIPEGIKYSRPRRCFHTHVHYRCFFKMARLLILAHVIISRSIAKKKKSIYNTIKYKSAIAKSKLCYLQEID